MHGWPKTIGQQVCYWLAIECTQSHGAKSGYAVYTRYHMTYQYQIFYIILSCQPLYHKCIYFIVQLLLRFVYYE